jgi:hypothetical protein
VFGAAVEADAVVAVAAAVPFFLSFFLVAIVFVSP